MSNLSTPYFDATFPSFVRKASRSKREQKPLKKREVRAPRPSDLKAAGAAFFRKSLLLGR